MKFYMFPVAPNAAKVRLYLAEKKEAGCDVIALAPIEEVLVDLRESAQKKPDYLKINPFGTVPALELDGGTVIHESLSIIEYLEECYPEASMWGSDPTVRAIPGVALAR